MHTSLAPAGMALRLLAVGACLTATVLAQATDPGTNSGNSSPAKNSDPTPGHGSNDATPTPADAAWQTLKTFGHPGKSGSIGAAPASIAADFLSQADQLKTFYTTYPSHPSARDAKRLEALALNQAALNGDKTQQSRRTQLVDELRGDTTLPPAQRMEVVAWSKQVAIADQGVKSKTARLRAQEHVTRDLIAEFPTQRLGYESLLSIARESEPNRAAMIVADLLQMSPPAEVAAEATALQARLALVGRSLESILPSPEGQAIVASSTGKVIIIYAWSAARPASLASARRLAQLAPSASMVGVNLDADPTAAEAVATRENLPGVQSYDARGADAPLAAALVFNHPPLAYLVDQSGVIQDVHIASSTREKLSTVGL
jgi:hypothetical protein